MICRSKIGSIPDLATAWI